MILTPGDLLDNYGKFKPRCSFENATEYTGFLNVGKIKTTGHAFVTEGSSALYRTFSDRSETKLYCYYYETITKVVWSKAGDLYAKTRCKFYVK